MISSKRLFKFNLNEESDFIEIGGGDGHLSSSLLRNGLRVVLFVEPDLKKYDDACVKLPNTKCLNIDIAKIDCSRIKTNSSEVTVIMQDVIEHIKEKKQKIFFDQLKLRYNQINFIGRTPNLKSPFGLRNSFGDNTHIYRFTDTSLKDFLINLGFKNIKVSNEPYKITGITSFLRYFPYLLSIYICSITFSFVYGQWEGFLSPNIVFYSEKL